MTDEQHDDDEARKAQKARWLAWQETDDDKEKDRHARAAAAAEKEEAERKRNYWCTARVLNWIAWRDPKLINENWLLAQFFPTTSAHRPYSNDPGAELLRALQEGKLTAFHEGQPLSPAWWARQPVNALPDVDFRRQDVLLQLWPPLGEDTCDGPAEPDQPPPVIPIEPERGPAQRGNRGRKPGSGAIQDEPHLLHMLDLLVNGAARNVHDAAQRVSNGTSSAADRLRKKFSRIAKGSEPPSGKTWADIGGQLRSAISSN